MYTNAIVFAIIFIVVLINIYHPFITTNTGNNSSNLFKFKNIFDLKNDEEFDDIVNDLKGNMQDSKSIYQKYDLIDSDGCYNPTFRLCNRKLNKGGYEIFTPFQHGCMFPDSNLSSFDTAYAQVDKYLNQLPEIGSDENILERKKKCVNKTSVKNGIALFGLCDRNELESRYCSLQEQKNDLADLNPGLSVDDLNVGLENMELINSVCFPNSPIKCESDGSNNKVG